MAKIQQDVARNLAECWNRMPEEQRSTMCCIRVLITEAVECILGLLAHITNRAGANICIKI